MRITALRASVVWSLLTASVALMGCSVCVKMQDCCPPPCGSTSRIRFDVPAAVHAGVLKALPGFVATEMEIESKDGRKIYEFEGRAGSVAYEIELDEQGNVLEIESGSEDGEEDKNNDDE